MIDLKSIPDALKEGESWQMLDLDLDWVWAAYDREDRMVGLLIAAPCHGLAMIWRVRMLPSAAPTALLSMFRKFIKDIRRRGFLGYMVGLDLTRPEEQALARIAFKAKALYAPGCFTWVVGSVNTGHLAEGAD